MVPQSTRWTVKGTGLLDEIRSCIHFLFITHPPKGLQLEVDTTNNVNFSTQGMGMMTNCRLRSGRGTGIVIVLWTDCSQSVSQSVLVNDLWRRD